ncbi:MAG: cell division protein ZapA [Gammaproteobacteria bacterium]|nr:cell division protein ZapA [Gammaproteobacteria bacterium]
MSATEITNVTINIMDREYKVRCPKNRIAELQEAAYYLNNKIRDMKNIGKSVGIDQLAVVAALNVTHDYLAQKQLNSSYQKNITNRLYRLQQKIQLVVHPKRQSLAA